MVTTTCKPRFTLFDSRSRCFVLGYFFCLQAKNLPVNGEKQKLGRK